MYCQKTLCIARNLPVLGSWHWKEKEKEVRKKKKIYKQCKRNTINITFFIVFNLKNICTRSLNFNQKQCFIHIFTNWNKNLFNVLFSLGRLLELQKLLNNNFFPSGPIFSGPRYPGEVHLGSFFNNVFLSLLLPTSPVTLLCTTVLDKPEIYLGNRSTLEELSLHKDAGVFKGNTVELQWFEHLWNHENMFETGVVRANES